VPPRPLDRAREGRQNAVGGGDANQSVLKRTMRARGITTRWALACVALAAAGVCLVTLPHAHDGAHAHAHAAGAIPAALSALAVALLAAPRARRRPVVVAALIVCLTVFAFETALHAVHHLGQPDAHGACAVASATAHLTGACASVADTGAPTPVSLGAASLGPRQFPPCQPIRPREGRAPPVPVLA